jgi:hypothetical protein
LTSEDRNELACEPLPITATEREYLRPDADIRYLRFDPFTVEKILERVPPERRVLLLLDAENF